MTMDTDWALNELDAFLKLAELHRLPNVSGVVNLTKYMNNQGKLDEIVASAQVAEQIFDRVLPNWRTDIPPGRNKTVNRWCQHIEAAQRAQTVLHRQAETQNKLGRRDVSEVDLFNQAFSTDPPQPGKLRLRVMPDDGSKTFSSIHRGIRSFADGCYAAIRNPLSHTEGDLTEDQALEQLAALSVLARWVDTATLKQ